MKALNPKNSTVYKGLSQIYLQGNNALQVASTQIGNEMHYYIGNERTNLLVHDFRRKTTGEALSIIWQEMPENFSHHFNQRAFVEIYYNAVLKGVEINLYDTDSSSGNIPLLWMGVLENNLMPCYKVEWEIFKPIDVYNTAFVAFIVPAISHYPSLALKV